MQAEHSYSHLSSRRASSESLSTLIKPSGSHDSLHSLLTSSPTSVKSGIASGASPGKMSQRQVFREGDARAKMEGEVPGEELEFWQGVYDTIRKVVGKPSTKQLQQVGGGGC